MRRVAEGLGERARLPVPHRRHAEQAFDIGGRDVARHGQPVGLDAERDRAEERVGGGETLAREKRAAEGREPMRTFSDLQQFFQRRQRKPDGPKSKEPPSSEASDSD